MGSSQPFAWLRTGAETLRAMLQAIQEARRSVRLEMYIYADDAVGRSFLEALLKAQEGGAQVQVLLDAVGSLLLPGSFWDPLRQRGGEFRWFNPLSLKRWSYRNHRKLLVCDDQVAFVSGANVAQEYAGDGVTHGWRDLGMRISGPLVRELAEAFDRSFSRAGTRHRRLQRLRRAPIETLARANWKLILSGPGRQQGQLRRTLEQDLAGAREVQIISAYFLPTWRLRRALTQIARRGGRVQLILAGKSDVVLSQLASRRLYYRLLRAGVEIYEYAAQVLHAKLFIVEDRVYAGSANLDTRSLRINYELLIRVSDAALAREAREIFVADLEHCVRVHLEQWQARSMWSRLAERWAYFLLARLDPFLARRSLQGQP